VLKLLGEDERATVMARSMLDYVNDSFKEDTAKRIAKVLAQGGRAEPFETQFRRADDSTVDVEVYGACVMYEGEVGVQMALQDITERKLLEAEWRRLSRMDGLTGIYNRRAFDEILERELRRSQRNQTPLSLALIDIDAFKLYNDHYGHQGGDDTLKRVAAVLRETARRGGDHVARYGGEEFAVIMAETPLDGALQIAERLRAEVEALAVPHAKSPAGPIVTISIGVRTISGEEATPPSVLIEAADKCLYRAKRSGRNRVEVDEA
jgi:diguanylate cyclase (GGDEF)-like protein